MKIAVISDIHGNIEALDAVMQDIKEQECEKIFVLGDYAMAGPEPSEAVDYFMVRKNNPMFRMIKGNTDEMITEYSDEIEEMMVVKAPIMLNALKDDIKLISPSQKIFLKELPIQLEVIEGGVKFLLVHGSPRKNNENILPDTPLSEVEQMIKDVNADVILCGHTHIPCGFQTSSKKTVVNDGSVGRPFTDEAKSCYLIVNVEDGKCQFEHRFVDYDREKAASKLLKRNFWGADKLAKTLIDPKERHF